MLPFMTDSRGSFGSSCNLTPLFFRVLIGQLLTFPHPRDQSAVVCTKNVPVKCKMRQKKLGFQLSHAQPRVLAILAIRPVT